MVNCKHSLCPMLESEKNLLTVEDFKNFTKLEKTMVTLNKDIWLVFNEEIAIDLSKQLCRKRIQSRELSIILYQHCCSIPKVTQN